MFMITKLAIFLLVLGNLGLRITEQSDHLKAGDMLNDSNPSLCSAGDVYCLSFATSNDPTYLSIYNRGTEATVWNAPRTEPLLNQSSAALSLDHFGALKMTDQGGEPIILYPPSSAQPQPVDTVATLLDTGNFVLEELHPNGVRSLLWQSFDHPTDTLLPGMRLGFNNKTGKTRSLVSDISGLSVIPGGFTLEWEHTRRQLIIRRRGQDYWASGELINGMFKDISKEVQRFYNYTIISNQDEEYFTFATTRKDEDARWTLSYDGLITDSRGNEIANAGKCYGYNDDGGCQLRDQPPCRHVGEMFDEMDVTVRDQGITYDVDGNEGLGLSDCKATCWSNCGCVGFTSYHDNEAGCVFYYENSRKNVPEGPVLTISLLVNRTLNTGGPWPAPESEPAPEPAPMIMPVPSPGSESNASTKKIKWLIAISITTLFIICAPILWLLLKRRKLMLEAEKKRTRMEAAMLDFEASNENENANELQNYKKKRHDLRLFSYASIMEATNGFSSENKLGEGGFGPVYKGKLQMGKDVAVKRLSRSSGQGVIEFKNELRLISKLQHTNLVQLLGCCIQGDERILIYEYMPNKSLDYILFDATRSELLDWKKRFSIIESIAQGLLYLHKYSRLTVVHRDLKASNILLDENMNPKISDFGLAKIITQESEGNTQRIVGTYGYMPPEYAMEGVFSIKSDVYSFGILMLEIVSGRRNNSFYGDNYPLNLVGHAWELWKQGAALALVDPAMKDSIVQDQVLRCIHVGLLCAEERAVDRPTMTDISSMLANESAKLPLLKRPAFCFLDRANEANESLVQPKIDSSNGLSISDLSAR